MAENSIKTRGGAEISLKVWTTSPCDLVIDTECIGACFPLEREEMEKLRDLLNQAIADLGGKENDTNDDIQ